MLLYAHARALTNAHTKEVHAHNMQRIVCSWPARNIFVFTLALSDLLLAASIPLTLGDALTQVVLNIWFT